MKLCYYKGQKNNFGDDLNPYIINNIIPNYRNIYEETFLLFIGTILYEEFANQNKIYDFVQKRKIVFGSGVRFINNPPKIDQTWDIRFLRGPLSSLSLLKNCDSFITDPAYLIQNTPIYQEKNSKKKYKISLMPHFLSLDKLDWNKLCKHFEIHFINPSNENLEQVIKEIAHSEFIITEAMHGAIIADAFRVPWKRFKYSSHLYETDLVSEFKWSDWLYSMNLDHIKFNCNYNKIIKTLDKTKTFNALKLLRYNDIHRNFEKLLLGENYQLSDEKLLNSKVARLYEEVLKISNQ